MTSYFNVKKLRRQSKQQEVQEPASATSPPAPTVASPSEEAAASPILDDEDEKFLQRLTALAQEPESTPPPLPERPIVILQGEEKNAGKDAQSAIMDGADAIPLPMSPPEVTEGSDKGKEKVADGGLGRKKSVMSYFALAQSKFKRSADKGKGAENESDHKEKKKDKITGKDKERAADDLLSAARAAKVSEQTEAEKEQEDLTNILDQLNLSAVNNRVFSFSKESEELLNKFKVVLKDIVNGAPTAYKDLELLLTDSEAQLKKMYGSLPPFLQNLVKSLPTKLTAALGPELLAAQAEKPGFDAKQRAAASGSASKSNRARIPSLKTLVSAEGAVATMLRSILNFLKLRFPAVMTGTNVLLSLAVFLLLFVFWYCHKRGRETRLEKERVAGEDGGLVVDSDAASFTDDGASLVDEKLKEDEAGRVESETAEPPLIIRDGKEPADTANATVDDMPSVLHLPEPKSVPLPETEGNTPLKEEPLKVPESK